MELVQRDADDMAQDVAIYAGKKGVKMIKWCVEKAVIGQPI